MQKIASISIFHENCSFDSTLAASVAKRWMITSINQDHLKRLIDLSLVDTRALRRVAAVASVALPQDSVATEAMIPILATAVLRGIAVGVEQDPVQAEILANSWN